MRAPAVRLDLCDEEQRRLVWQEIERADAIWLAPPCGTSSRARGIRLPSGGPQPKALRSAKRGHLTALATLDRTNIATSKAIQACCVAPTHDLIQGWEAFFPSAYHGLLNERCATYLRETDTICFSQEAPVRSDIRLFFPLSPAPLPGRRASV